MAVPESTDSGANPSLYSSIRSLWSVLLAIVYTRLDLFTAELEDEAARALRLIIVSLAATIFVIMTLFFLMFFLVVLFWAHAAIVLGAIFASCVLVSFILILTARKMILERPKFLEHTLGELRRDVEGLRTTTAATPTGEPKS